MADLTAEYDALLRRAALNEPPPPPSAPGASESGFSYTDWMTKLGMQPPPPPLPPHAPERTVEKDEWLQPLQTLLGLSPREKTEPAASHSPARRFEQRLRRAFESIDLDGSGSISKRDLYRALQAVGVDASTSEMLALYQSVGADGSGQLSWKEFKALGARFRQLADLGGPAGCVGLPPCARMRARARLRALTACTPSRAFILPCSRSPNPCVHLLQFAREARQR